MPKLYFYKDSPNLYDEPSKFYKQGGSPELLKKLLEYITTNKKKIKTIYISYMLFNNTILHNFLKSLPNYITIQVYSIPLEGYDISSKQFLYDLDEDLEVPMKKVSKYDIAQEIYNDFKNNAKENYHLNIFPHLYVRSKYMKGFSRGTLPYSLHIKSMYIEFNSGLGSNVLSSSNFASVDKIKEEIMVIVEGVKGFSKVALDFYKNLENNSIPIREFNDSDDFNHFKIIKSDKSPLWKISNKNSYLGPFYNQSQHTFKHTLNKIINSASQHIYICAQHISAYTEKNGTDEPDLLNHVINKAYTGIPINILSQTYSTGNDSNEKRFRVPVNKKAFIKFIKALPNNRNVYYGVNSDIHSKFIVVDDIVIYTTCNLTPTQFIYNEVNIESFKYNPYISYSGIHSEVGQYIIIKNKDIANLMIKYFKELKVRPNTIDVSL